MNPIVILCVEDEADVRAAVRRDLAPFAPLFRIEEAEDVADAREVLALCASKGWTVGLVLCDHIMPGDNGVEFLVSLNRDPDTRSIRKILLTGQAGQEDTIRAVNEAGLNYYIAKPWNPQSLQEVVRRQLTDFVLETCDNLMPFVALLDGQRLLEEIAKTQPGW